MCTHSPQRARLAIESLAFISLVPLSSVLVALAFPPWNWDELAWVALVPFAAAATVDRRYAPELYFGALIGGIVLHLIGLDWMRTAYGGSGLTGARVTSWMILAIAAAPLWPLALAVARRLTLRAHWPMFVALPTVWTSLEYVRFWHFQMLAEIGFPWLQLGHTQIDHGAISQVADLGGVWLVTAIIALFTGAFFDLGRMWISAARGQGGKPRGQIRSTIVTIGVVGLVLVATAGYGRWQTHSQLDTLGGPVVLLVPSRVKPGDFNGDFEPPPKQNCDLLVWPEVAEGDIVDLPTATNTTQFSPAVDDGARLRSLAMLEFSRHAGTTLVVGCDRIDDRRIYNCTAIVSPYGWLGTYDKTCLVPWREFTPSFRVPFLSRSSSGYSPGERYPVFTLQATGARRFRFASTICYDSCFPAPHRRFMRSPNGPPDFFVVSSNEHADGTLSLQQSMLMLTRWRAIECRRPFARSVQNGYSSGIDSCGRVIACAKDLELSSPFQLPSLPLDSRKTWYVTLGDWVPASAMVVVALGLLWPLRSRGARIDDSS